MEGLQALLFLTLAVAVAEREPLVAMLAATTPTLFAEMVAMVYLLQFQAPVLLMQAALEAVPSTVRLV